MSRWIQMFTRLGRAFLDWLSAELEQLAADLRGSSRQLLRASLLIGTAGMVGFFGVGALTAAAIAGLSVFMATWAAALLVGGLLILKALALGWIGLRILARVENPGRTFARRWAEQEEFWRDRLLDSPPMENDDEINP